MLSEGGLSNWCLDWTKLNLFCIYSSFCFRPSENQKKRVVKRAEMLWCCYSCYVSATLLSWRFDGFESIIFCVGPFLCDQSCRWNGISRITNLITRVIECEASHLLFLSLHQNHLRPSSLCAAVILSYRLSLRPS